MEALRKIRKRLLPSLGASGSPVVRVTLVAGDDYYTVRRRSFDPESNVGTALGSVGATILAGSKVILLSCLGYLLRFLDPRLAEVFYMDTDSIFVALCHPRLEDNVSPNLRQEFLSGLPGYVNTRDCQKLSGYLLLEETAAGAVVFGEKMYTLVSPTDECFKTRMKGVAYHNLKNLTLDQSLEIIQSDAVLESSRRAFKRVHAGPINMISDTKRFKLAIHPRKRNFTQDGHSFPRC